MILEKRKRAEIVLEKIEQKFLNNQLQVGDKLPSERELANLFEVSRNSVREALQILALNDVIETRRGGGSFVKRLDTQLIEELSDKVAVKDKHLVFEMLEVRRALEVEAAALAARRATAMDLKSMRNYLRQMATAGGDVNRGAQADFLFHMQIIEASHNSILVQLAQTLMEKMEQTVYATRRHRFMNPGRHEETYNEHKEIYVAIASGDSEVAKRLMNTHISQVRKELGEHSVVD